jgi:hypothetical protein
VCCGLNIFNIFLPLSEFRSDTKVSCPIPVADGNETTASERWTVVPAQRGSNRGKGGGQCAADCDPAAGTCFEIGSVSEVPTLLTTQPIDRQVRHSRLMGGTHKAMIGVDRKTLSDLTIDPLPTAALQAKDDHRGIEIRLPTDDGVFIGIVALFIGLLQTCY